MELKEIFATAENGVLSFDQFTAAVKQAGIKLADLSTGDYVSKNKYDADLKAKDDSIKTLNDTITKRDTDLEGLKTQLKDAGTNATKLEELTSQFDALKDKYDADTKNYQAQIAQNAYEYAVRDFANSKSFTSNAAKRDFISAMIAKKLTLEGEKIIGGEDFTAGYLADNPDAFVTETEPAPTPNKPTFVSSTDSTSTPAPDPTNGFASAFNFTSIRGDMPKRN